MLNIVNVNTLPPEQACALALEHHRAGRFTEAEQLYRHVLAQQPNHPDAWHALGVLAHQLGRHDIAVEMIAKAIALSPQNPAYHSNLGEAYRVAGQFAPALAAYRQAIQLQPDYAEAYSNLGNVLTEQGQLAEAVAACRRAIELRPDFAPAHYNLGVALHRLGDLPQAGAAYRQAVELRPDFAPAYSNLGTVLKAQGRLDQATAAYRRALELRPEHAADHSNLGVVLMEQGQREPAIAAYRRALELQPNSPDWRYVLAGLTGDQSVSTAPASYVRALFDDYAGRFDEHLVGRLDYRGPEQLHAAVVEAAPGRQFDILDLGCGTGLCGVKFRPLARDLAGVDLSPKMIAQAAARGVYDRLITGDVVAALRAEPDRFDLLLAGDLFVYLGDLRATFAAAATALRDRGLFALSLERHDGAGFVLQPQARFAHSLTYIRELAGLHGLAEVRVVEVVLRKEVLHAVAGWVVLLEKRVGNSNR